MWVGILKEIGESSDKFISSNLNIPVKLVFPTFEKYTDKVCSWISITDIVVPGSMLSYLYRFDRSKGVK